MGALQVPDTTAQRAFSRLRRAKLIRFTRRQDQTSFYTAMDLKTQLDAEKDRRTSFEGRIWTAIRMVKGFSVKDLQVALHGPEFTEQAISRYINRLLKFGYLRKLKAPSAKQAQRFRLIMNTGPLPPIIQRTDVLRDPNNGEHKLPAEVTS